MALTWGIQEVQSYVSSCYLTTFMLLNNVHNVLRYTIGSVSSRRHDSTIKGTPFSTVLFQVRGKPLDKDFHCPGYLPLPWNNDLGRSLSETAGAKSLLWLQYWLIAKKKTKQNKTKDHNHINTTLCLLRRSPPYHSLISVFFPFGGHFGHQ